jgi:hypothetical protein
VVIDIQVLQKPLELVCRRILEEFIEAGCKVLNALDRVKWVISVGSHKTRMLMGMPTFDSDNADSDGN